MLGLFDVSELLAREPSARSPRLLRPLLRSIRCSRVLISTLRSLGPVSKSFVRTCFDPPWSRSSAPFGMQRLTSLLCTRLSSSVALLVSQRSRRWFPISSTARNRTAPSILMRLLRTVLLFRLLFFLVIPPVSLLMKFSCWMSPRCLLVSRLLVAS